MSRKCIDVMCEHGDAELARKHRREFAERIIERYKMGEESVDHQTIIQRDEMEERVNKIGVALGLSESEMEWSNLNDVGESCIENIEVKEKELATAKAENGRLEEALNYTVAPISGLHNGFTVSKGVTHRARMLTSKALSTSNALDYWQGEIRKARYTAFSEALAEIDWRKTQTEIIQAIEKKMLDAMGSNQSKGENLEPGGGG